MRVKRSKVKMMLGLRVGHRLPANTVLHRTRRGKKPGKGRVA